MDPRLYPSGLVVRPQINAEITVGDESSDVRAISIQLKGDAGQNLTERAAVMILVLADANGDALVATGGSTGIEIGTDGALIALLAKKVFMAISEDDGHIDLTWTDTGTETAYLAVVQADGSLAISSALTNAA